MSDIAVLLGPLIPQLRRYARALLRNRDAADDLVQDCLERAVSRWHSRRADGNTRAWLFTILHNMAMDRFRSVARHNRHEAIEDAEESALARPPSQEDGLHIRDLERALERLSGEHRCVLRLISVNDLSYAEAARVLNVPIGTIMSRLARARKKMALAMEGRDSRAIAPTPVQPASPLEVGREEVCRRWGAG